MNTHFSDPNDSDSDNDVISDGAEVTTYGTNPSSIDTDGDGYNDPTEILSGSNPLLGASVPGATHIARVLGADAAEGLDLTGNFLYAFNVGTPGAAGLIHDANFTADTAPGISVDAPNEIGFWNNPDFGANAADNALEFVFQSIRWADLGNGDPAKRSVKVNLANLVPGRQYKLQLLFGEACCPSRTFDLHVEGTEVISDFVTRVVQGGYPMPGAGSAMVHTFTATDSTLNVVLDGGTTSTVSNPGNDPNAILSGVTLEELTMPVPIEITSVSIVPGGIKLDFRGTPGHTYSVDWAPDLATWEEVNDNLVPNGSGDATWTDTDINRVGPGAFRGFYKLRDPTP